MISLHFFRNIIKYPRALLRILFVIVNNIYCIPTYLIWMFLLMPLKKMHPETYYKIEGKLFHWLLANVAMWSYSAGYDLVELGDDITPCLDQRTLVLVNHQSTADVPLLMTTFNTKQEVLPNIMWIMDKIFKYTNFGCVSVIHQDFFIGSGPRHREEALVSLRGHLERSYVPRKREWMVLFPEGGFLRKRREASQRYAQKNNYPLLQHVTLPRIGAMKTIIDVVGPENDDDLNQSVTTPSNHHAKKNLKYILDITIAYPDGEPLSLPNIVTGMRRACQTHLLYRLYRCSEVPREEEPLTAWLYDRFIEKEELLSNYYATGSFAYPSEAPPTVVHQDLLRFFLIHLFFITSSYLHFQMFVMLIACYRMYVLNDST
ncbi:unnamed protein product [Diamesa hyperborea]